MLNNLRFVVRRLLKHPAYIVMTVVTLALGIGASTSIFSVADSLLLNPLPYSQPRQLVRLAENHPTFGRTLISYSDYLDWRANQNGFQDLAGYLEESMTLSTREGPKRVRIASVTASLFHVLDVPPIAGRLFSEKEDRPGCPQVAVLGQNFWSSHFGSDPKVMGQTLVLNHESFEIIGVVPGWLNIPEGVDVYLPLGLEGNHPGFLRRNVHAVRGLGRLKSGVTEQAAKDNLAAIAKGLETQFPDTNKGIGVAMISAVSVATRDLYGPVVALIVGAAFVLLIACANVSALMLARALDHKRQTSIQIALGASRRRVIAETFLEGVILALLGGGFGLLFSIICNHVAALRSPSAITQIQTIQISWRAFAFAVAISVLTGALLAAIPAFQVAKIDLSGGLKEAGAGPGGTGGRKVRALRSLIVIGQVMLATILLISSGLLIASFIRLQNARLGFDPNGVLTFEISLPDDKYAGRLQQRTFFDQLRDQLRRVGGVESVATGGNPPYAGHNLRLEFSVSGRAENSQEKQLADAQPVSPDYFTTMRIALTRGRPFEETDMEGTPPVAIIDDALAKIYWAEGDPVGKQFDGIGGRETGRVTIVGVVPTVRHHDPAGSSDLVQIYYPERQDPSPVSTVLVRTSGEPLAMAETCRKVVRGLDPDLPIFNVRTMEQLLESTLHPRKLMTLVACAFAILALFLSTVGIYTTLAYSIAQRTREIGVRIALGASHQDVSKLLLREGMSLVIAGIVLGTLGTFALAKITSSQVYGIPLSEPLAFATGICLLILAALLACSISAGKLLAIDPARALRYE